MNSVVETGNTNNPPRSSRAASEIREMVGELVEVIGHVIRTQVTEDGMAADNFREALIRLDYVKSDLQMLAARLDSGAIS